MNLVKTKNSLHLHIQKHGKIDDIIKVVKEIPNVELLKNEPELIRYVLELLNNSLDKKHLKLIDIKQTTFDIINKVFPGMTQEEKNSLTKIIDYLINNKQIEKIGIGKKVYSKTIGKVCNFFSIDSKQ